MTVLDKLPVATITFLVGLALVIVAYLTGDISFNDAYQNVLYLGGGSAAIGYVRNQAGKGVR